MPVGVQKILESWGSVSRRRPRRRKFVGNSSATGRRRHLAANLFYKASGMSALPCKIITRWKVLIFQRVFEFQSRPAFATGSMRRLNGTFYFGL
jgi:hypothetical protein